MRKGLWLQIMLDEKTLKFDFDGTFPVLLHCSTVLRFCRTRRLQITPQNCDQNIAYGLILKKTDAK